MYEETQGRLIVYTDEGLHARVFYKRPDEPGLYKQEEVGFWLYPQGNKKYGLAAFYVFMAHMLRFHKPNVEHVGSVSELSKC